LSDFPLYLSMGIMLFWGWALLEANRQRFAEQSYY
jgi:hypothetical protein